jgi:hypothetical protein
MMDTIPTIRMADFASGDFVARRRPCLISDGLAAHEGLRRWTPEYLAEMCGDVRVNVAVSVGRAGWHPAVPQRQGKYTLPQVPLRDAVRWITSSEHPERELYVPHEPIQKFPPLCGDITFEKPLSESKVNIWFGTANTVSGLHHDRAPNWYAQVYGEKQFILFSPDQVKLLYPRSSAMQTHTSAVDPVHPDLVAHPRFAEARPVAVTVRTGEVLFLPSFWWHHVTSLSVSISVNQWWRADLSEHYNPTGARLMTVQYVHDSWATELKARNLQLEDLLDIAEQAAPMDQAMAALPLCVLLDNFDRWPDHEGETMAVEADIRQGIERLRQAVLDDEVYEISRDTIAALARRVREESVLGEFARGFRPARV